MASVNLATFLSQLRECQLLEPATQNEIAASPLGRGEDPLPVARQLTQKGLLTPFQINQLLVGRGKELLVGPYRLLDRLGEGGMGQVFKALHPTMGRVVALKIIRKEKLSNPQAVRRFQQEVQAAAKLVSPNIVVAFDAGQVGDTHFFAMEYVEGIDLSKLVKTNGPLPVVDACEYLRQAASGLQHAHERGLVHRDIKPGNLLLSKSGPQGAAQIKILDMGLARLNDPDGTNALTRIGSVIGTPDYLAPEQAQDSHKADIRADLYSLGCTFFYLLAGRPPFKGNNIGELLMKHQMEAPPSLEQVRPEAPPQLGLVLKKLLAKKPEERYQTPADLVLALSPFVRSGSPSRAAITAAPPSRPKAANAAFADIGQDSPRSRRRRGNGVLVKFVALLLLLAGLAGAALAFRPQIEQFFADRAGNADKNAQARTKNSAPDVPASNPEPAQSEPNPEPTTTPTVPEPSPPTPSPEPKTEVKIEPKPPQPEPKIGPKLPVKVEPKKPAVPPDDKLAVAEKTVRDTYKLEFARKKNEDMVALAGKLLNDAAGTKDDMAARFVLLREARELGTTAGHAESILNAIDEMDKTWAIDAMEMKITALDKASKATNVPPVMRSIAEAALSVSDEAVDEDRYDAARRLTTAALTAARKGNNATLLTKVQNQEKEVAEIAKEFQMAKAARDKLASGPDDEANSKWGKFLSYYKGHWGDGLPLLSSGSDEKVLILAQKDQTNPKETADQVEVGDGWYALGEAEKSLVARKNLWIRAKFWYDQAQSSLSGFNKIKVDKRIKEIAALLPKDEPATTTTATTTSKPLSARNEFDILMQNGQTQYRSGRYTDAAATYQKAVAAAPDAATNAKAQNALKQARYAEAIARGTAFANQGRVKEAADEFRKALDEAPGDPTAERYLAWATTTLAGNTGLGGGQGGFPFMRGKGKMGKP